ncbi:MAG TPA: cytochrome c [Thermoanaerobaculia bacterium]|nr:cytochrome c [Thermoanaerobaculia bacterium]
MVIMNRSARWVMAFCIVMLAPPAVTATEQAAWTWETQAGKVKLGTGKQIYDSGCAACHGPLGKGQSQSLVGFQRPSTFPDFSDCSTATPEPDSQWRAIITNGGPARAFSAIMPSFKDQLTPEQIGKVIDYLRSLCAEKAWPRGNLNLPRPLITEKAFPENEAVMTGAIDGHGAVATSVLFEKRIGASAMIEAIVPYEFTGDNGTRSSAFGDLALGYKQKLFHSVEKGSIFSVGGEVIAPTGDPTVGTGGKSTVFELFTTYGQLLPGDSFLQVHAGVELPTHPAAVSRAVYLRTAIGKTFSTNGGLGRRWSPMAEVIADRDLVSGASTNWDIVPEIQIPISKRMHILGNVGYRIPLNNTADRPKQLLIYLLWDWVDGGLTEGW